jgi:ABC-type nitrate/sulfonate/bicarbonate transport system permease component
MHAGVLAMSTLGLGSYSLVDWLHRRLRLWQFVR